MGSKPNEVIIYRVSDSNMAGFSWSWKFWISKRKDQTYSVCCKQIVNEPPAMKVPGVYRLKTGQEIKKAFEDLLEEAGLSLPEDQSEILSRIEVLNPKLAKEFQEG